MKSYCSISAPRVDRPCSHMDPAEGMLTLGGNRQQVATRRQQVDTGGAVVRPPAPSPAIHMEILESGNPETWE